MPARRSRVVLPVLALCGLTVMAYAVHGLDAGLLPWFPTDLAYDGVMVAGAVLIALRALTRSEERLAWSLVAVGMACSAGGDVLSSVLYPGATDTVPVPAWSDLLYIGAYPPLLVALVLLGRKRSYGVRSGLWLDGAAGALSAAAVAYALLVAPSAHDAAGAPVAELATTVAYPLADLALIAALIATTALAGWHVDRRWAALAGGVLGWVLADSAYLVSSLHGSYEDGDLTDLGWLGAAILFAWAAWRPRPAAAGSAPGRAGALAPLTFAAVALSVLVVEALGSGEPVAVGLAAGALALIVVRMTTVFADHQRLLHASREEARTDELTGLWNRRRLMADLDAAVAERRHCALLIFDLDGFKAYNDSFGHPAGDGLLRLVAEALRSALGSDGEGYRMGGDEFCALVGLDPRDDAAALAVRIAGRLAHGGDGFWVGASVGYAVLPEEADEAAEALRLADRRLYAAKQSGRVSAGRQSTDVLLAALSARSPDLADHLDDVASLAAAVGARLGLEDLDLEHLCQAAELHDVGKVAVPERVLAKPGPLDEAEWALMREHTVVGERILGAAPSLVAVGRLVRATHERVDGTGYPDGLVAEQIPLGARIIFVCDAYAAMVAERPYDRPRTPQAALAELRRCAGSQFDARVVEAFAAALAEHGPLSRSGPSRWSARAPEPSR